MVRHDHRRYPHPQLRGTPALTPARHSAAAPSALPPPGARPVTRTVLLPPATRVAHPGRCANCGLALPPTRYCLCDPCRDHLGSYTTYYYAMLANHTALAQLRERQEQLDAALPLAS